MRRHAYTKTAMALHWGHALLLCGLVIIGLDMVDLPKGQERTAAYALHKSLGLIALVVVALRLAWRLRCPPPVHSGINALEMRLANTAHRLLYLLLVLVPATGFASICFTPYPLKFFGLPLFKPGWPDPGLNQLFSTLHQGTLIALGLLVFVHVAAALRHAWRRDGTLSRMLPHGQTPR